MKNLYFFFLFFSFVLPTSCNNNIEDDLGKVPQQKGRINTLVFGRGTNNTLSNTANYRIPCLTDSPDGSILYATTDLRYESGGDLNTIDVGFCRSLDNGKTWTDYKIIFKHKENSNKFSRVHDASMCVDRNPKSKHYGRIWAFAKMINTDLPEEQWETPGIMNFMVCFSDDEGLTWSNPITMNNIFPSDAYHTSTGITPGITLSNGTLVQPVYFTRKKDGAKEQKAFFLYSTDGETWDSGDITPKPSGENSIVQQEDGTLIMNARDAFSPEWAKRRVFTLKSIGTGWINRPEYETIRTVNCQESLVYNKGIYLYSQPTGYEDGTGRNRITIFRSTDLINWEKIEEVTNNPSLGYSTLIFRDNKLGILFENAPFNIYYSNFDYLLPIIY